MSTTTIQPSRSTSPGEDGCEIERLRARLKEVIADLLDSQRDNIRMEAQIKCLRDEVDDIQTDANSEVYEEAFLAGGCQRRTAVRLFGQYEHYPTSIVMERDGVTKEWPVVALAVDPQSDWMKKLSAILLKDVVAANIPAAEAWGETSEIEFQESCNKELPY